MSGGHIGVSASLCPLTGGRDRAGRTHVGTQEAALSFHCLVKDPCTVLYSSGLLLIPTKTEAECL